jgi:hypothetical protein
MRIAARHSDPFSSVDQLSCCNITNHPSIRPLEDIVHQRPPTNKKETTSPFTSFAVDDVNAEAERLRRLGVRFTQEPLQTDSVTTAVLDDTCGNLIQIASQT